MILTYVYFNKYFFAQYYCDLQWKKLVVIVQVNAISECIEYVCTEFRTKIYWNMITWLQVQICPFNEQKIHANKHHNKQIKQVHVYRKNSVKNHLTNSLEDNVNYQQIYIRNYKISGGSLL